VVCGIPLVLLLPVAEQRRFIDAIEGGGAGARLPALQLLRNLAAVRAAVARREAWTPLNFPPASVWRYTSA
jgi:phosphatidylethanolamine/phosphatidyl-N-methylethanolamine N-methyltransferase